MNREDSLKTREQRFKGLRWNKMFVQRKMITSKAFLSLRTAAACKVLMIFLNKCKMELIQHKPRGEKEYYIANNGEIQFTYIEAEGKWGISSGKFKRAIEQLVAVGLIDIAKPGSGLFRDVSLYAISDRWEEYGTDEFVHMERPKRKLKIGFRKGNKHGKNSKPKKKSRVTNNS